MKRIAGYILDALFLAVIAVGAVLLLTGCAPHVAGPLDHAAGYADALESDINHTAADAGTTADRLQSEAKAGAKATPERYTEAHKHWYAVGMLGEAVRDFGAKLLAFGQGFEVIKTDLSAAAEQTSKLKADLAKAKSDGVRTLRHVQVICLIAVGAAVAVGLAVGQFKISVIGIVSALATAATAQLLISFDAASFGGRFWAVLAGVAGAGIVWLVVEWRVRGSFKAAIKSNPFQDLMDLMHRTGKGVATVTTTAGTVGIVGDAVAGSPQPVVAAADAETFAALHSGVT